MEVEPVLPSLHQLTDGLSDIIECMRENPESFKTCFLPRDEITYSEFIELFDVVYSERGSNKFKREVDTYKHFVDFLEECFYLGMYLYESKHILKLCSDFLRKRVYI